MSPDILVMDEPTASLDPLSRRRLIELLKTFKHTKIIATHDLDMAMDVCERTIVLHKGRITADGPTAGIFGDERLLHPKPAWRSLCGCRVVRVRYRCSLAAVQVGIGHVP
jgi:energy-coupling factor transporter ATP-binding protein EcfA2